MRIVERSNVVSLCHGVDVSRVLIWNSNGKAFFLSSQRAYVYLAFYLPSCAKKMFAGALQKQFTKESPNAMDQSGAVRQTEYVARRSDWLEGGRFPERRHGQL